MKALNGKGTYAAYTSVAAPMDDKTLLYTSLMPNITFHTQTNVAFPDDLHRTRTAYSYDYTADPSQGVLSYSSLYREDKVNYTEFVRHIEWARAHYNTHPTDYIQGGGLPMNTTCLEGSHMGAATSYTCPSEIDWCAKGNDPSCAPVDINVHIAGTSSATTIELPLSANGAEVRAEIDANTTLVAAGQAYSIWIAEYQVTDTTTLSSQLLPGVNITITLTPAEDTSEADRANRAERTRNILIVVVVAVVLFASAYVIIHEKRKRDQAEQLEQNKGMVAAALAKRIFSQMTSQSGAGGSLIMHELEEAFNEVDVDHDGRIAKSEFVGEIRNKLGTNVTIDDHDLDLIWSSISHGDDDITYMGFSKFMEAAFEKINHGATPASGATPRSAPTVKGVSVVRVMPV
jgi:hypothetical protein